MPLGPLKDLPPRYDVKGGSPRTPSGGIPVREYEQYAVTTNGNGVWKTLAGASGGLWVMSLLAWWTAFQGKGVARTELRDELKEYKEAIEQHATKTDTQIGELKGREDKIINDLNRVQYQQMTDERDFTEFKTETKKTNDLVAGYLEQLKVKK